MPPKQAGKFKPLKRPPKPIAKPSASTAASAAAPAPSEKKPPRKDATGGRSGGRGRDGRGRGRGRGRFNAPTGAAFFTGTTSKPTESDTLTPTVSSIAAGQDGAVVLPFTKPFSNDATRKSTGVARTNAESMAASAAARLGEGEEIIVAELEGGDEETKKVSVLERGSRMDGMPSLFDDENNNSEIPSGLDAHYVYDSDSSEEERRRVRKGTRDTVGMMPLRLPFDMASYQSVPMYECQENVEEKKVDGVVSSMGGATLADPEVTSPFLDWMSNTTTDDMKMHEKNSWFLMKFPTRLPLLDHSSLVGGASVTGTRHDGDAKVKSEYNEDDVGEDVVRIGETPNIASTTAGSGGPVGYDNTLKDIAPGRYGKILVYKSGRTELVVGGHNGGAEVRMLINEGLQCGFRQEAVSIDTEEGIFVPMGDVTKSLIVTPDVERAFFFS